MDDEPVPQEHVRLPSSKVANLAEEVEELETKCNMLEQRNSWLTQKLMKSHQRFVDKLLMDNVRVKALRCFEGWRDAMHELRLERQLDEQTMDLDKCQQVVTELGTALTAEQEARRTSEAEHRSMQDDLHRAVQQETTLKQQFDDQQLQLEILERQMQEAETCLTRSRADAQAVVESANAYQKRLQELELDTEVSSPSPPRRTHVSSFDHMKVRAEAHGVMQKMSSLLTRGDLSERDL